MNVIVKIDNKKIGNEVLNSVNARDLHKALESNQQFTNWIQNRIKKYGFIEGEDFLINLLKTPNGGRPSAEYYITLDMAKELAMVENNPKGREVRRYFIKVEKEFRGQKSLFDETPNYKKVISGYKSQIVQKNKKIEALNKELEDVKAKKCDSYIKILEEENKMLKSHIDYQDIKIMYALEIKESITKELEKIDKIKELTSFI